MCTWSTFVDIRKEGMGAEVTRADSAAGIGAEGRLLGLPSIIIFIQLYMPLYSRSDSCIPCLHST